MSKEDNGGPAFPQDSQTARAWAVFENAKKPLPETDYVALIESLQTGLSVRDYFASKAPVTVQDAIDVSGYKDRDCLKHDADRNVVFAVLTMMRYEYADAMLSERKR